MFINVVTIIVFPENSKWLWIHAEEILFVTKPCNRTLRMNFKVLFLPWTSVIYFPESIIQLPACFSAAFGRLSSSAGESYLLRWTYNKGQRSNVHKVLCGTGTPSVLRFVWESKCFRSSLGHCCFVLGEVMSSALNAYTYHPTQICEVNIFSKVEHEGKISRAQACCTWWC